MQVTELEFAREVREALARMYDPAALHAHPLNRVVLDHREEAGSQGGAALRRRLLAAIDALKPGPHVDPNARAWRPYRILQLRYVEALDAPAVQQRLAISKSQYYREHEAALASLIAVLWDQRAAGADSAPSDTDRPNRPALAANGAARHTSPVDLIGPDERLPRIGAAWRRPVLAAGGFGVLIMLSVLVVTHMPSSRETGAGAVVETSGSAGGQHVLESPAAAPSPAAGLSIYAGTGEAGHTNGAARLARFAGPLGLTIDVGRLYVADTGNHRIRSITDTGLVLDVAGSGVEGYLDGPAASARFSSPNAVTVGPDGTIYVADAGNLRIRAISPSGTVSTVAGSGVAGLVDGVGAAAQFTATGAIVADRAGNLYVPDRVNNVIRKITPAGVVSTFAGSGTRGHLDGPADVAQFNQPARMATDAAGNVYVGDTGDNRIRRITPDGVVSTVAGTGVPGFVDGPVAQAQFSNNVMGICVDASGILYVMDAGNRRIRQVTPEGIVSTVFEFTNADQTPANLKVDRSGNLYLSDRDHNLIYKVTVPRSR